ncbi:unnamed protein product [Rhodiola kirilowii]
MNSMPEEMKQMKEMMVQILRRQPVQIKPCEFCSSTDHKTDACPTLIVDEPAEVNAVVGYQGYNNNNSNDRAGLNRQYNQATNLNWRNENHPPRETQQVAPHLAQSFYQPPHRQYNQNAPPAGQYQRRGPNQYPTGQYKQKGPNQYQAGPSNQQGPNKSLEDTMKELAGSVHQFGKLPSQTIQNPKGNVNAVTLKSGKKLVIKPMEQEEDKSPRLPGKEQMRPEALRTFEQDAAEKNEDASEKNEDTAKEEGNAPEERSLARCQWPARFQRPRSTRGARYPEPRPPKSAPRFHFQ